MAKATAKERGYFGVIREPGEVFEVPDGTTSNDWFDVEGYTAPAAPAPPKAIEEMGAKELLDFAKAENLDIGDLKPQHGREKILAAVKVALTAKFAAVPPAPAGVGRASDQDPI